MYNIIKVRIYTLHLFDGLTLKLLRGSPVWIDDSDGWPSLDDGRWPIIRRSEDFGDLAVVDWNTNSSRQIVLVLFESRKIIVILFYLILSYPQASSPRLHRLVKHIKDYCRPASNAHIYTHTNTYRYIHINWICNVNLFCII